MNKAKLRNFLEATTNIAVLLIAMAAVAFFARSLVPSSPEVALRRGLQKGETLAEVAGIDYSQSTQTLLIALSSSCRSCAESIPFYKQLEEIRRSEGKATCIVGFFLKRKVLSGTTFRKNN